MECSIYKVHAIAEEYTTFLFLNRMGVRIEEARQRSVAGGWYRMNRGLLGKDEQEGHSKSRQA